MTEKIQPNPPFINEHTAIVPRLTPTQKPCEPFSLDSIASYSKQEPCYLTNSIPPSPISDRSVFGIMTQHISRLDKIMDGLNNKMKNQNEEFKERIHRFSSNFFESTESLKTQDINSKKWEVIKWVVITAVSITTFSCRNLEPAVFTLVQLASLVVFTTDKYQKRGLCQLKAENIQLNYQMKKIEDQQDFLNKNHEESSSNLLRSMFLLAGNV